MTNGSPRPGFYAIRWALIAMAAIPALWLATQVRAQQPAAPRKRTVAAEHGNNLNHIDCKKHESGYSGVTTVEVNATDGIAPEDEAIFVCSGEKLQWVAGSGVKTIVVSFAKSKEWPFKEKYVAKLSGDDQHPTAAQEIHDLPTGHRLAVYKYTIHVITASGAIIDLDPHVIPVGP